VQNKDPNPARSIVEAIREQHDELQRKAKKGGDNDILFIAAALGGRALTAEQIGTVEGTDFVYIAGFDEDGYDYRLIQHYTQVSLLFTFIPASDLGPEERRPIGFVIH
jgi:hypothetical protein